MTPVHEKILGWTWQQWAIAAGRYGLPDRSIRGAIELRKRWQLANPAEPGEVLIVGAEIPMDHDAACELYCLPWRDSATLDG